MGFGSSKSSSQQQSQNTSNAYNQSYPFLQSSLGSQVSGVNNTNNLIASLLGLNGSDAGAQAFDQFRGSSGYNFVRDEGVRGITGNKAASGLLNSGSTLKAISGYSSNLANQYLTNYLSGLMGLSDSGLRAGQILAQAGNTANSQGTSSGTSTSKSSQFSLG